MPSIHFPDARRADYYRRAPVPSPRTSRRASAGQLAPADSLRHSGRERLRRQPRRVRRLRAPARHRLPDGGRYRLGGVGDQQLLAQPPLDVRRQARAPDVPGLSLLRRIAGRLRLHLWGAGGVGRRRGDQQGDGTSDRDRRRHTAVVPRAEALELQGLVGRHRRFLVCLCLSIALAATLPGVAPAATTATDPNAPVLVLDHSKPPAGYRLTASQAQAIAARSPVVRQELRRHPGLLAYEYTKGPGRWQVSWFTRGAKQKELVQVYVDDASGRITEAWTGFQVAWTMARGYSGAFGRRVTALYVWIPMCLAFAFPFLPLGRRRRGARGPFGLGGFLRRPTLLHLDLLVALSFSVSLAFFDHARIGLSVPLAYPPLLYLLARMLLLAFGRGRPRRPLPLIVPASWLAVAIVFLVGF